MLLMKPRSKYYYLKLEFKTVLKSFESFLNKQGYSKNTVRQYLNYTACFLQWIKENNQAESQIKYPEEVGR